MHLAYVDARIENYRVDFVDELSNHFDKVSLLAHSFGEDIKVSKNQHLSEKTVRLVKRQFVYFSNVYSSLSRIHPDVILTGDLGLRSLLCLVYAKKYSIPVYAWARLTNWSERDVSFYRKLFRKLILIGVSGVFVNGKDGAEYINTIHKVQTHVLHQSSSHSLFAGKREVFSDRKSIRWVYVGRLIEQKGLIKFFNQLIALDPYLRKKMHFDIVGEGILRTWLENIAQENNLNMIFHGTLNGAEVVKILDNADIFFFPSLGDEWGLAVVEAMNRGLPVLGSNRAGAVVELSKFGDFGKVFDPESETQIKEAIHYGLLMESQRLQTHSNESLRLASDLELQPKGMAKKLHEMIRIDLSHGLET